ncbi:MAG: hypothetical protein ACJ8E4_06765 [Sphingomicrobium sp.]
MSWAKQHPVETVADYAAPALLAAASGWAARSAFLPPLFMITVAILAFAAGMLAMRISGGQGRVPVRQFEPVALDTTDPAELLLEEKDQVLLLDDPLIEVDPDSRVVRLFARQEPTPGELVERIADFLGEGRRPGLESGAPTDASAALHAALANIRASLR